MVGKMTKFVDFLKIEVMKKVVTKINKIIIEKINT